MAKRLTIHSYRTLGLENATICLLRVKDGRYDEVVERFTRIMFPVIVLMSAAILQAQTRPATTPAEGPREALLSLSNAAVQGDESGIRQRLDYHGPLATELADATIQFDLAQARLRKAAHKAFADQDLSILVFGSPEQNRKQLSSAKVEVEGNNADIVIGDQTIRMVRVDGRWKRSVMAPVEDWPRTQVEDLIVEMRHQAAIYDGLAQDVEEEKFHTPRQAAEELREQLLKATSRPTTRAKK